MPLSANTLKRFERYQIQHGLSQNTVNCLLQDHTGFLWVCTQDGLNRFDGYQFKIFQESSTKKSTLNDDYVISLFEDDSHTLWVGTRSGGLNKFNAKTESFSHFSEFETMPHGSERITAIAQSKRGQLILGSYAGILKFDPSTEQLSSLKTRYKDNLRITSLIVDSQGNIWAGTRYQGLIKINSDDENEISYYRQNDNSGLGHDTIWTLFEDDLGTIWVGTEKGAFALKRNSSDFISYLHDEANERSISNNIIRNFTQDLDGHLWIATDYGINHFNYKTNHFERLYNNPTDETSIGGNSVNALYVTRDNVLWLGLFSKGLNKHAISTSRFEHIKHNPSNENSLSANNVWTIAEKDENHFWIGTDGGGLNLVNLAQKTYRHFKHDPQNENSLMDDRVWAVLQYSDTELWIGSYINGVSKLNLKTNQYTHYRYNKDDPFAVSGDSVVKLFKDKQGRLWLGTNNGLSRYDRENDRFIRYLENAPQPYRLPQFYILNITQDKHGQIWLSTYDDGAIRLNPDTGEYVQYLHDDENQNTIAGDKVLHILEDSSGKIWVSTYGSGISILNLNDGPTIHFNTDDGLANNSIYAIVEDNQGLFWISTNNGLSKYDPVSQTFTNYTLSSGIQSTEYNTGAYLLASNGLVFFGGVNGVNYFEPRAVENVQADLRVTLTGLRVFNELVPITNEQTNEPTRQFTIANAVHLSDAVVFGHRESLLSFEFSTLNYAFEKEITFQYRLLGFDEQWITTGHSERRATYTNIPPGRYTLLLRAKLNSGYWSEQITQLEVTIKPAPWFSWYAYAIYFSIIAIIVVAFINQRVQKFKKVKQSEQRLSLALWGSQNEFWDWDLDAKTLYKSGVSSRNNETEIVRNFDFEQLKSVIHPDDFEHVHHCYIQHINNESDFLQIRYRKRDNSGQWRWFRGRAKAVSRDSLGYAQRIVGTIENVNALVEAEIELQQLNEQLEQRVDARTKELKVALENLTATQTKLVESEKMASLVHLVAGVAHELNTPLGIILTSFSQHEQSLGEMISALKSQSLSKEQLRQFESSAQQANQLMLNNLNKSIRLVQNFKALSLPEMSEQQQQVDINNLLDDVRSFYQREFESNTITWRHECDERLSAAFPRQALFTVLSQLVENSIIHAFEDNTNKEITVFVTLQQAQLVIEYRDNGKGVELQNIEKLYEPFYTTKRGTDCTGLGLTIVYNQIHHVLNGDIKWLHTSSNGIDIRITLPL